MKELFNVEIKLILYRFIYIWVMKAITKSRVKINKPALMNPNRKGKAEQGTAERT